VEHPRARACGLQGLNAASMNRLLLLLPMFCFAASGGTAQLVPESVRASRPLLEAEVFRGIPGVPIGLNVNLDQLWRRRK